MADDHKHDHKHHHHHGTGNIKVAFFLNFAFTIIEIIGGFFTNSLAILSDALHDLGDTVSLGLAWYFQKISGRGRDASYSYGYKRFSVLGALINSIILVLGTGFILYEAIPRLWNPTQPDAKGMIFLAILGVIVNGAAVLKLKSGTSVNERVVSLHLLEDVLGWVAVLIGSIVMYFYHVPILDPILSIGIGLYILYNVLKNLKHSIGIIMQAIPPEQNEDLIKKSVMEIDGIIDMHDIHLWSLDGDYHILTTHLVLKGNPDLESLALIKNSVRTKLESMGITHSTIEFETEEESCALIDC